MNAFDPDYVKTYMPQFLTDLRIDSRQTRAGQSLSRRVEKIRETMPSHGTILGITSKVLPDYQLKPKEMMRRPTMTKAQRDMTMEEVTIEILQNLKQKGKK